MSFTSPQTQNTSDLAASYRPPPVGALDHALASCATNHHWSQVDAMDWWNRRAAGAGSGAAGSVRQERI